MGRRLSASVGRRGVNREPDVRRVQQLLNNVVPESGGPRTPLVVDGKAGHNTTDAIQQFQLHHFGWSIADGRVDPDGNTFQKLVSFETPCSEEDEKTIVKDLKRAKAMLDEVMLRLGGASVMPTAIGEDTKKKVKAIFDIDLLSPLNSDTATHSLRFALLLETYGKLRASLDHDLSIVCEKEESLRPAYVSTNCDDPTIHLTPQYFRLESPDGRPVTLIHERAHTMLCEPGHPGMMDEFGNDVILGVVIPHEGQGLPYEDASRNPFCYEWLALSLQPTYDPEKHRDPTITR